MFASPFVQHYTRIMRNTRVVRLLYMIPDLTCVIHTMEGTSSFVAGLINQEILLAIIVCKL